MRVLTLIACLLASSALLADGAGTRDCRDADAGAFTRGQSLYRSGEFLRALGVAEHLCACQVDNVDYQFLRALALNALGREAAALEAGRIATALAPDYGAVSTFVETLQERAADASSPVAESAAQAPVKNRRWTVIASAGAHDLTNGRDGWTEQSLTALVETASGRLGELRIDREARGGARDTSLHGGIMWPLGHGRRISGGLMLTPSATFRAEQLLTAQLEQDLPDGWVARLGLNHRRFADDRSEGMTLGIDRYYAALRFSLGLNLSSLDSAGSALSQVASIDWYVSDRQRYRITLGNGKELDTIADGTRVLESQVRSVTIAGQHQVTPRTAIGWWLGTLEQGTFYDRRYAGFSLTRRY